MDYAKLVKKLIADMKKGVQYNRMSLPAKIFAIIGVVPLIVSFVLTTLCYWITLFFYKMLSAPAEQLQHWLTSQKDDVQHATQAVMYWICMPFIFFLQVLLSLNAMSFYIIWFSLMVQGYLLTFGGIKWQPFIMDATFDDDNGYCISKPSALTLDVLGYVLGGTFIAGVFFRLISNLFKTISVVSGALGLMATVFFIAYFIVLYIVNPCLCKTSYED